MADSWTELFSTARFMPHGHCFLWQPGLLWLQVASNGLIGLSYVSISSTLAYLVYRFKGDMPFRAMYLAFGAFIVLCGMTHFVDVWVIWSPEYWIDGVLRMLTALVSATTALLLPRLIPDALVLARGARAARERGVELETAVQDWQFLYEKTKDLERLKSQFFANVSHELRTPLTLILGPVESLLASPELAEQPRRDLGVVLRNARTLHKHVDDLLDAAKLEAGRLKPSYAALDLARLLRVTASCFDGLAAQRGIAFEVHTPAQLRAELDPDQIERVVQNLLSNAFKFTPEGGRVRCSAELLPARDGGGARALICVADSGPGIAPEHREAIFERFRQLDGDSAQRSGGTGLGLTIARDLAALHGGSIAASEAPEGGALFSVLLPATAPAGCALRVAEDADTAPRSAPERPAARDEYDGSREGPAQHAAESPATAAPGLPLVLVVEDHPDMSAFVAAALSSECRIECARDGEEGLAKALALQPELIVSDVMMPRMSGDALLRELRSRPALAEIPVVLLTARADDSLRVQLLRDGAQDYVIKPFSPEELRARVANLLRLKRAQDALREAKLSAETARDELEAFSYSVAHDLRAPLRGIDGFSQVVLESCRERLDPQSHEHLQRVRAGVARMAQLIDDLLKLARLARSELHRERVDLSALVRAALARLQEAEPDRELELVVADGIEVQGDDRLLALLLENLLANSWKFTSKRSAARIEFGRTGTVPPAYYVRDDGAGFDMAHAGKLFQVSQRLHGPGEFEGTGIGLATAQRIIRRHGGTIWAEGEVGKGATFYFTLPGGPALG